MYDIASNALKAICGLGPAHLLAENCSLFCKFMLRILLFSMCRRVQVMWHAQMLCRAKKAAGGAVLNATVRLL